ncbi:MAG: ribosome assembly cofactor RimP [Bacteroidota bacterium]
MAKSTVPKIERLLEEKFKEEEFEDCYIVEIEHPADNRLHVFLDSDSGITFEKCRKISRYLEAFIDEEGWMGEKYTLEVSSPGLSRPLKLKRQYPKNVGREVEVITTTGEKLKGKMIAADDQQIKIEYTERIKEGKKKRNVTIQKEILHETIQSTKIKISFK